MSNWNWNAPRSRLAAALVIAVAIGLLSTPARAQERSLVILDFSGSRAARYRDEVVKIVERDNQVISATRYAKLARKLKARKLTARNVAKVCGKLDAGGVLSGKVKRRGKRYTIELSLRDGATGTEQGTAKVTVRGARLSRAERNELRRELLALIDELPGSGARARGDDDGELIDDEGLTRGRKGQKGKRGKKGKTTGRGAADEEEVKDEEIDEDAPENDDEDNGEEVAARPDDVDADAEAEVDADARIDGGGKGRARLGDDERADLAARGRALDLSGGLSAVGRTLSFDVTPGLVNTPQGYRGSPVAGGYVAAELYPLAFNLENRSFTRNLGISGELDRVIKIESRFQYVDPAGQTVVDTLATIQQRFAVGAVYRHNFGSSPTSPTVRVSARYNQLAFLIDKAGASPGAPMLDIPNVKYTYFDPGVALRYPISSAIAVTGEGRFLIFTATGEIEDPTQYGSAQVSGIDVGVQLEYHVSQWLSVRGGGRLIDIGFTFDGNGMLLERDGNAATTDVSGASDRYLGGYVSAGYLF